MTGPSADAIAWLTRLVAFDTTSRESNLPLIEDLAEHARALGVVVNTFLTPDGRKANLLLTVPSAAGETSGGVFLSGHSDCVPVDGQDWASDPFAVTEREGRLYGRGTADMKGFLACCLAALPALLAARLAEPVHVGFSYDEEVGCIGAAPFVESMKSVGILPRLGFVGEPSMMRMIRGHKSINLVYITLTGVAAHSSLTDKGVNAIEYAAEIVRYWRGRADQWRAEGPFDEAYPLPFTSASVNRIEGGNAVNTVPASCLVTLEFRGLPSVDDQAVLAELVAFCAELEGRMQAENPAASVVVDIAASTVGLDMPADAPVVAFGEELGLTSTPEKVTYGTEAGVFTLGGIPCVVCGPGDIGDAHRANESVALDQLAQCEAFLGRLISRLSERPSSRVAQTRA